LNVILSHATNELFLLRYRCLLIMTMG